MLEGRSVFHESYYEHSCSVVNEKDVIYTDIKGGKCISRVKRWWFNLFLLSYDDERCRIYNRSSQAMRLERLKQFRRYRGRIHPLSKFSRCWNFFILVVVIVNRVIFQHNTSIFFRRMPFFYSILAVVLEFIQFLDIFISIKTGYEDKEARTVVLSFKKGLLNYATTKLFWHVASAMPLQTILLVRYGTGITCGICKANRFVCTLKLLSVFGLYRVYDASAYLARERSSFKVTYFFKFTRIFVLGLITMLQFLNFSDTINILVVIKNNKIDESSSLAMVMLVSNYLMESSPSSLMFLCMEFSFICKSLLLFGHGLKPKLYYLDILFCLLGYLIANAFYMWSLVECYAVINRLKYSEDQNVINQDRTTALMRCRQLSDKISAKLSNYYDFNMTRMLLIEKQNDLYQFLPHSLKREMVLSCYTHHIRRIPYFSDWPLKLIEGIILMLKEEVFLEHDIVADTWSEGEGLVILDVGVMAVYSAGNVEIGHLIDGDYFGELSLVTDKEIRTSSVVAVTRCKVLFLSKSVFRKYMRQFPKTFFELRKELRLLYAQNRNRSSVGDFSNSRL